MPPLLPCWQAGTQQKAKEEVPDVEWWDAGLLPNGTYDDVTEEGAQVKEGRLTVYVEHPVPIEPPLEAAMPPPQPLKLTKRELKKLRTQKRRQREMEKQELIRQVRTPPHGGHQTTTPASCYCAYQHWHGPIYHCHPIKPITPLCPSPLKADYSLLVIPGSL